MFFGHKGSMDIEALKILFTESHKGIYGLYWDGEKWMMNEAGVEFDDVLGDGETAVYRFIDLMDKNSDDIFEKEHDTFTDFRWKEAAHDSFRYQAKTLATKCREWKKQYLLERSKK
jgi:hypothetical protein